MERTDNRVSRLQTQYTYESCNGFFWLYHIPRVASQLLATSDHLINLPSSLEVLQVLLECRHKCWEGINWEPKDFPQHLDEGLIYVEPETQKGTLKCVSGTCKEQERENMLETHTAVDDAILQYIITVIPQRCHFRGKLLQKKRK